MNWTFALCLLSVFLIGGDAQIGRPSCPKITPLPCIRQDDIRCTSSSQCKSFQSCCRTPCGGTQCFPKQNPNPTTPRPGCGDNGSSNDFCCHRPNPTIDCRLAKFGQFCNATTACGLNNKCCPTECGGTQCKADIRCPPVDTSLDCTLVDPRVECDSANPCPAGEICCTGACKGTVCVKAGRCIHPIPAGCPKINQDLQCFAKDEERCGQQNRCQNKGELCCPTECDGTQCVQKACNMCQGRKRVWLDCNECSCKNGQIAGCTKRGCPDKPPCKSGTQWTDLVRGKCCCNNEGQPICERSPDQKDTTKK